MADPASLQNLHDIVIPAPVPWWPPAPGWYAVFAGLAVLGLWLLWRQGRRWKANAYRRSALSELERLKGMMASGDREPAMRQLPELLKKTALSVWSRDRVASLTGREWMRVLNTCGNTDAFSDDDGRILSDMAYAGSQSLAGISGDRVDSVVRRIEAWIREHRVS